MKIQFAVLGLAGVLVSGCQNPYPADGELLANKPSELRPVAPVFILDAPNNGVLLFAEGTESSYAIHASVPFPGEPQVEVSGLPARASFENLTLKWSPDFGAADDPTSPASSERIYPVVLTLRSSLSDLLYYKRLTVLLKVRNTPRSFTLSTPDVFVLNEGQAAEDDIRIINQDFPKGPFKVDTQGLPSGALVSVDPADPSHYAIQYTPSFSDATVEDYSYSDTVLTRHLNFVLNVADPSGRSVSKKLEWDIQDTRLPPMIIAPSKVQQGLDADFQIVAEDPNGEVLPKIILTSAPGFGVVTPTPLDFGPPTNGENPRSGMQIHWNQIPTSKIGTTASFTFRACVNGLSTPDSNSSPNQTKVGLTNCVESTVSVTLSPVVHQSPVVDRTQMALSTGRYVRVGDTLNVSVPVADGESGANPVSVSISPDSMKPEVSWTDGVLSVTPQSPGTKRFVLTATSIFGVQTLESFTVEALPASWSSRIILGESLEDPEIKTLSHVFTDAKVVNPSIEDLDERLLALRDTVFIGTSSLSHPNSIPEIEAAFSSFKNVVIATPLIGSLRGALKDRMHAAGVSLLPRWLADPAGLPPLGQFRFMVLEGSGLDIPKGEIGLGGTTTAESGSPELFDLSNGNHCQTLLNLQRPNDVHLKLLSAVSCPAADDGKTILAGFEWADLKQDPPVRADDGTIVDRWLKELLK